MFVGQGKNSVYPEGSVYLTYYYILTNQNPVAQRTKEIQNELPGIIVPPPKITTV